MSIQGRVKRLSAPTVDRIVEANGTLLARLGIASPATTCWCCADTTKLERCHIVAHRQGGSGSDPSNYFLLCRRCHAKQPDALPRRAQELWLTERLTRGELEVRLFAEMLGRVIKRLKDSGVPPKEIARYMHSYAFKAKAAKIDHRDFDVRCTSLEYLIAEYLP